MKININSRSKDHAQMAKDIDPWVDNGFKSSWIRNGKRVFKKSFTTAQKRRITESYKTLFGWEKRGNGVLLDSGTGILQGQYVRHRPRSERVKDALIKQLNLPGNMKAFPIQSPKNRKIHIKLDKNNKLITTDSQGIKKSYTPFIYSNLVVDHIGEIDRITKQYPKRQRFAIQTGVHNTMANIGAQPKKEITKTIEAWFEQYGPKQPEQWLFGLVAMDFGTIKKSRKLASDLQVGKGTKRKFKKSSKKKIKRKKEIRKNDRKGSLTSRKRMPS